MTKWHMLLCFFGWHWWRLPFQTADGRLWRQRKRCGKHERLYDYWV